MGPNFIYFGAQKYGYRPIPSEIETEELMKLIGVLETMGNDVTLLKKWYRKDNNKVLPKICFYGFFILSRCLLSQFSCQSQLTCHTSSTRGCPSCRQAFLRYRCTTFVDKFLITRLGIQASGGELWESCSSCSEKLLRHDHAPPMDDDFL